MEPHGEQAASEVLHQRGWRKAFTVSEMVDKWASLVSEVEGGYGDMVEEYANDLYSRNWLHKAWPLVTDRVITVWTPRIRSLDDRFKEATIFDDGQALSHFHRISDFDPTDMWWWRRHPRRLVGELGDSLRAVGASD
ncbi:hypothetical protein AB0B66_25085 [Catellatospora sp. NPDC049111]|uniref:hypothetical protein n=1 Tax=Catellatospora sp. NPDC049111 TaxID=3155271 RepID=UPI0033FAFBEE